MKVFKKRRKFIDTDLNDVASWFGVNINHHIPAGVRSSQRNFFKSRAIRVKGAINIHAGIHSINSGGCILIGTEYIKSHDQLKLKQINSSTSESAPNLQVNKNYKVTGFDKNDTVDAQAQFTWYLYCIDLKTQGSPSIKYTRTGSVNPPLANNPWDAHGLTGETGN